MSNSETAVAVDSGGADGRWTYGLYAVLAGLVAILIALGIALTKFKTAADVGAVLGVVVSPIATIVGAYFGVQAGAAGKAAADDNARKANDVAVSLAASLPPGDAQAALARLR